MGAGGPESKLKTGFTVCQTWASNSSDDCYYEKLVTHLLRFMLRVHHRIAVTDSSQLKLELHNLAST